MARACLRDLRGQRSIPAVYSGNVRQVYAEYAPLVIGLHVRVALYPLFSACTQSRADRCAAMPQLSSLATVALIALQAEVVPMWSPSYCIIVHGRQADSLLAEVQRWLSTNVARACHMLAGACGCLEPMDVAPQRAWPPEELKQTMRTHAMLQCSYAWSPYQVCCCHYACQLE